MTKTHTAAQIERFRTATIAKAEAILATRHAQYRGMWNDWRVVLIKRTIRTKLGTAFVRGEWAIATVEAARPQYGMPEQVLAFSMSNVINTAIGDDAVEWLDGARPAAKPWDVVAVAK